MNENLEQIIKALNECKTKDLGEHDRCFYNAMWYLIEYTQDLEERIKKFEINGWDDLKSSLDE